MNGSRLASLALPVLLALAFSAALVLGAGITFDGGINAAGLTSNHIRDFGWLDLLRVLALAVPISVGVMWAPALYRRAARPPGGEAPPAAPKRSPRTLQGVATGAFALAWLPALLTYAPGGVSADALYSINQALYAGSRYGWNNHHPVLFAALLRPLLWLGERLGGIGTGVALATTLQFLLLAVACGYCVAWLARHDAPPAALWATGLFFALYPAFAIVAAGLSKDVVFSALVLVYSLQLVDVVESRGETLRRPSGAIALCALSLLVIFIRNNGVLLVLAAGVGLVLALRGRSKALYASLAAIVLVTAIVQGPVFSVLGVRRPAIEAVAVPMQQIAYVIVTDGTTTAAERRFLFRLLPEEDWRALYTPTRVDPLKGAARLDKRYLAAHAPDFVRTWAGMALRNPGSFAAAYLLETFGYWRPWSGDRLALALPSVADNDLGIRGTDIVARVTGRSFASFFEALAASPYWRMTLNVALAVWLALLSAATLVALGRPRHVIGLVPCLASWLGVMVAAPIAFTYRYLLTFVVCLPLIVLLPLVALRSADGPADTHAEMSDNGTAGDAAARA